MKILHLTHTDLRYDNRILKEIESLGEVKKYTVTGFGVELEEGAQHASRVIAAKIFNIKLLSSKLAFLSRPIAYFFVLLETSLRFLISSFRIKPNVVHCHDTMVLPVGALIKILFRSKLIYDAHELESDKNGQSKILSKATLIMERMCWKRIDHLISVSDSIISWYNHNLGKKNATLILNSPMIGEDSKTVAGRYFHEKYSIPEDKLVFVYLGYLGKGRSIEDIISVFSTAEVSSHVVFLGYGDLVDFIEKKASLYANIHFHGSVAHDQIISILRFADVGFCLIENVSLSDYFCLPNKLFEYTFSGVPIIASDFPDIRSVVEKYKLGKFCSLDFKSILRAVKEMEYDPPGRIASDLTELGWDHQAEKLRSVYSNFEK